MSQSVSFSGRHRDRRRLHALVLSCTVAGAALSSTAALAQTQPSADVAPGEIVVSAQRREETLSKVPLSIAAYTQKDMDKQGVRSIDDIARITPALRFNPTSGVAGNNGSNISIRGLSSDVGSSTTALYLDDTPIQIRNVGYFGGNPYPRVFDLDRVEVLRGPQGTLFGASAEGGAVRFITPAPSFDKLSIYSREQISVTEHGAPSYEAGLAVGAPITENLAARGSFWYQHVGGYIDQVAQGTDNVIAKDINSQNNIVARGALTWKPAPNLTITPKVFYQFLHQNARDDYWEGYGNANASDYHTGVYKAEPTRDRLLMPSLSAELKLGNVTLASNSSFLKREQDQTLNYATYFSFLRSGSAFGTYASKDINNMDDVLSTQQRNFSQELRAYSYGNRLIDWSAGAYYSRSRQHFSNFTASGRTPGVLVSGFAQYAGIYSLVDIIQANDRQYAGFGSVDIKPTSRLTLTGALRYTRVDFDFNEIKDGPTNGGLRTQTLSHTSEGAWTPKFAAKYQLDNNAMFYASISKGYRPAGAQPSTLPDRCAADLTALGLSTTSVPTNYKSDSLWSYEAGGKGKLLGGKLVYDVSGYILKWQNIQQAVRLNCGFNFVSNLGGATGRGLEFSLEARPVKGFSIGANVGYTNVTYDGNVYQNNGILLRSKGERINGPLWTGHAFADYERPLASDLDGYGRIDYSFTSRNNVPAAMGDFGYDAGLYALAATNYLQLRMGVRKHGADVSLFIDNLTNSHDVLSRNHDGVGAPLYYDQSYRPRTYGLTLQYRY